MTYGIVVRCGRSGQLGYAVAGSQPLIGAACCDATRAAAGVALTLVLPRPANNLFALRLLAQGFSSTQVLRALTADDADAASRLIVVMDREGKAAAQGPLPHRIAPGMAAFGPEAALDAMAARLAAQPDADLSERLLAALEAAVLPARSAAVVVQGIHDHSDHDLRVDDDADAVAALRRIDAEYAQLAAYYIERARNPREAIPQMEFVDMLKADRPQVMP